VSTIEKTKDNDCISPPVKNNPPRQVTSVLHRLVEPRYENEKTAHIRAHVHTQYIFARCSSTCIPGTAANRARSHCDHPAPPPPGRISSCADERDITWFEQHHPTCHYLNNPSALVSFVLDPLKEFAIVLRRPLLYMYSQWGKQKYYR